MISDEGKGERYVEEPAHGVNTNARGRNPYRTGFLLTKAKGATAFAVTPSQSLSFYSQLRRIASHPSASTPARTSLLAAPARTPAAPAPVAASIARHDGSAEAAGGGVAQVDESGEGVRGVDGAGPWPLVIARWPGSRTGHIVSG